MSYLDYLKDDIMEKIVNIRTDEIEMSIHILEMQMLILENKWDKLEMDSDGNNTYYCTYNEDLHFHRKIKSEELFKIFHIGKVKFYNHFSRVLSKTYLNPNLFDYFVLANDIKQFYDDCNQFDFDYIALDEPTIIKKRNIPDNMDIFEKNNDITYYSLTFSD
jgi:hypothetical protein